MTDTCPPKHMRYSTRANITVISAISEERSNGEQDNAKHQDRPESTLPSHALHIYVRSAGSGFDCPGPATLPHSIIRTPAPPHSLKFSYPPFVFLMRRSPLALKCAPYKLLRTSSLCNPSSSV